MKKIILILIFCSLAIISSSQFFAWNKTSDVLRIGVEIVDPASPCDVFWNYSEILNPGESYYVLAPGGYPLLKSTSRVGWENMTAGTFGFEYSSCSTECTPSSPGPYTFNWDGMYCTRIILTD